MRRPRGETAPIASSAPPAAFPACSAPGRCFSPETTARRGWGRSGERDVSWSMTTSTSAPPGAMVGFPALGPIFGRVRIPRAPGRPGAVAGRRSDDRLAVVGAPGAAHGEPGALRRDDDHAAARDALPRPHVGRSGRGGGCAEQEEACGGEGGGDEGGGRQTVHGCSLGRGAGGRRAGWPGGRVAGWPQPHQEGRRPPPLGARRRAPAGSRKPAGRPVSPRARRVLSTGGTRARPVRGGPRTPVRDEGNGVAMTENGDDTPFVGRTGIPDLRLATDVSGQAPVGVAPSDGPEAELPRDRNQAILEAAKQVGAVLKRAEHPFALAGSVAVYAHGGSGNLQHDGDFCVLPEDAERVAATLREAGLTVYTPPEDWLIKARCFGQDVDIIFEMAHRPVSAEMLGRAGELPVDSVRMPVLAPTDLLWSLMAAFSEH